MTECVFTKRSDGHWACDNCGYVSKRPYHTPPRKVCSPETHRTVIGPGGALMGVLQRLGVRAGEGCQCAARAAAMNAWGPAGCRERKAEIVAWLREAYAETSWVAVLRAGGRAALLGMPLTIEGLVDHAIRLAEESEQRC